MKELKEAVLERIACLGLPERVLAEWGEWTDAGLEVLSRASDAWLKKYLIGPNAAMWRALICDPTPEDIAEKNE